MFLIKQSDLHTDRVFFVSVNVNDEKYGNGEGTTKKQAEQNAAKDTLQKMNVNIEDFIK